MSSKLQENLTAILTEKLAKVKPENIKYGNTIFGVEGVAGKANIYLQRNEPTEKEGVWIQAKDMTYDSVRLIDTVPDEAWVNEDISILLLLPSENVPVNFNTQLVDSNIQGRLLIDLVDVYLYNQSVSLNDQFAMSYGDGEKWICFKNEDLLLPDEEPIPPLDYVPLESVTLTKQFITNYAPCSNTRIVLDYIDEDTTPTYYQNLVGASDGTLINTQMLLQRVRTSNTWRAYFGTAGNYGHEVTMNNNIRYVFDWNKNNIYIDGMLGTSMTYNEWTAASGYYLAINPLNEGDCSTAFKVYSFKIYENDELVRDYVPASKDDTFGFYEKVEGVFHDLDFS